MERGVMAALQGLTGHQHMNEHAARPQRIHKKIPELIPACNQWVGKMPGIRLERENRCVLYLQHVTSGNSLLNYGDVTDGRGPTLTPQEETCGVKVALLEKIM